MDRPAKFHPYIDEGGAHRWRLVEANGRIIADSAEGYIDRTNVEDAIERVRKAVATAEVVEE